MARKRRKGGEGLVTAIGLVRFYEEVEEKIKVPPEAVIGAAFALSIMTIALDLLLKAAR
ncbi:preprotein translocase subunit Sec61beta [Ignicoccus hospitalis]|uniref:Preprotein translocase subunit SecG n=1 Tax=Ignicoccus hospitalis (strain KIN4/I / DSM 18386 / JCM 14125) TaxID=453591 RepID=SECG_IGNH4|nr:preprotein translocase subunit Sec61beta [Ignicoccus hospitalis]A8ABD7.1 RecName: Full=Preprotein translocase subunit SecG; AltName: Full=Protein transport protein Sec61 subunit beta homolog [Ignicoccus hospitalis KIN4/I]ABU82239.1 Sec61beta [Ignicoccus hospitalis KIN4/I]HIH90177.1 preprotein translocase subunit Sec61beta [Desulfurococcaceae archaeon]